MTRITEHRLGELLVASGVISTADLERALRAQAQWGMRLGDVLIRMRKLTEDELRRQLSRQNRLRQMALAAALALGPWVASCAASEPGRDLWSFDVIIGSVDASAWQFQPAHPALQAASNAQESMAQFDEWQAERAAWLPSSARSRESEPWIELLRGRWALSPADGGGQGLSWHAKVKSHEMMVQMKYQF